MVSRRWRQCGESFRPLGCFVSAGRRTMRPGVGGGRTTADNAYGVAPGSPLPVSMDNGCILATQVGAGQLRFCDGGGRGCSLRRRLLPSVWLCGTAGCYMPGELVLQSASPGIRSRAV